MGSTTLSQTKLSLSNIWNRRRAHDYIPVGGSEQNENPPAERIESADKVVLPVPKKQRWQGYLTSGSIWGLTILASILLISLLLSIARSLWGLEDDPDKVFGNWGKPGTGTEDLAWYPTDFLRDVVPIRCHSHNDYWRKVPLFSALHAGCIGVEADVWLFDDDPELYVGHDEAALTPNRTFTSLYVNPLVELLNRTNPQTKFYNDTRRGVFDYDPEQTVILLVDLKTDGTKTWPYVLAQLEPLRSRGWLSSFKNGVVHQRQVTVVGTGNTPFDLLTKNATYRDAFFDAPLKDMWEDPDASSPVSTEAAPLYNDTNSFYASTSFADAIGIVLGGFSEKQLRTIRGQIKGAHRRGLKVRYWDTPSWPVGTRNKVWHTLMEEGSDILNVDDLRGASKLEW
ncbi:PLC-like phosphodiesterase [Daldinia caldariorum]|uniref:PLC-like phosphodiesterase n=1 Tax=Daldinia caldariorum TaxID=326644 RepID=UPI00200826CD|nr:PLC-like phosphodiesterase [Daldinia caldariorum]KAI1469693.1 PLC-like phosphodiesterase [Daldinia caldariorum]